MHDYCCTCTLKKLEWIWEGLGRAVTEKQTVKQKENTD